MSFAQSESGGTGDPLVRPVSDLALGLVPTGLSLEPGGVPTSPLVFIDLEHGADEDHVDAAADRVSASRTTVVVGVSASCVAPGLERLAAALACNGRNAATDRAIEQIIRAWGPDPLEVPGGDRLGHMLEPRPVQQPHPPVFVGGNSRTAMVRAARYATGWLPMYNPSELAARRRSGRIGSTAELAGKITELNAIASDLGRTDRLLVQYSAPKLHFHTLTADAGRFRDEVRSLAEAGVGAISVDVPGERRRDWLAAARRLSDVAHHL